MNAVKVWRYGFLYVSCVIWQSAPTRGPAAVSDHLCELGERQGGDDHRLYPRVHRARVEAAHGVLPDPAGEESQRENAPARAHRGTAWSPTSAGASNGATADAQHCPMTAHPWQPSGTEQGGVRAQPEGRSFQVEAFLSCY